MTTECDELEECAELLHQEGARLMSRTRERLDKRDAIPKLRLVAAIEEVAAAVEAKIDVDC